MHVHHHNTPSFSIFWRRGMQWWRCHGSCDMEGDVVDLVGFLRVAGYDKKDPDKISQALAFLGDRYQIQIPTPEPEPRLAGNEHIRFLPPGPEVIAYAASRGLTEETLKKFKVGQYEHFMTMPCFEDNVLKGIKMRNIHPDCPKEKRFWQLEGSRLGLYNFDGIYLESDPVFIVKGEIPCMLMTQIGFPFTCAPTGGEGSGRKEIQRWTEALVFSNKVVIGDNDGPGKALALKRGLLFGCDVQFPPPKYKDLDEWILADLEGARHQLHEWELLANWSGSLR
jgi:hypothetical protein